MSLAEAEQDGERSRGCDLGRAAEVTWLVHLGKLRCDLFTLDTLEGGRVLVSSQMTCDRTQGHGRKLHQGKFKLDNGKRLLSGTGFPGKAPNLSEFKGHLDDALSPIA